MNKSRNTKFHAKKKAVAIAEYEKIPRELAELKQQLENALLLKSGYLQKQLFTEELLAEMPEHISAPLKLKLEKYKTLCQKLQTMHFEYPNKESNP